MKSVVTQLNQLTANILQQRCSKQSLMVQMLSGIADPPSGDVHQKENSPPNSTNPAKSPNPYTVRGGGYRPTSSTMLNNRVSQSTLSPTLEETETKTGAKMSVSLNTGFKILDQCPLVTRLMQESQILKVQ